MTEKHVFLGPEWIRQAHALHEAMSQEIGPTKLPELRINLVVNSSSGAPRGLAFPIRVHIDTTDGSIDIADDLISGDDVPTITVDYGLAYEILIERNYAAAMKAVMPFGSNRIKVENGGISTLTSLFNVQNDPNSKIIADAIRSMTVDTTSVPSIGN